MPADRATPPRPGLVVVDKPAGLTSHDVVGRIRRIAGTRKVGHAGTLDPMATGVLLVGVERATKLLGYLAGQDKTYVATVRLGQTTVTDDAEGEITATTPATDLGESSVRQAFAAFVGDIDQVPSSVSAIKVGGVRSYARVRAGEEVELAARTVRIGRLDVGAVRPGADTVDVDIELDCSTGTYVRAIARDVGVALGVGGHLTALRRTRVGRFGLDRAVTLEALAAAAEPVPIGIDDVARAGFPVRELTAEEAAAVRHGRRIAAAGIDGTYAGFGPDGSAMALLEESGEVARTVVVIRPA